MEVDNTIKDEEAPRKIQTFVFLDLETTGLFNTPRILELSMVAISRNHLVQMRNSRKPNFSNNDKNGNASNKFGPPSLPRVIHKFLRLYYPRILIYPDAEKVHGLGNDLLEDLPPFTHSSAEAIEKFLNFPKPICFVAHNGMGFDFKILRAEIENVNAALGFSDILCIDTLQTLKKLDMVEEEDEISAISKLAEDFTETNFLDEEISCKKSKIEDTNDFINKIPNEQKTPEKNIILDLDKHIPQTPKKLDKPHMEDVTPPRIFSSVRTSSKSKNAGVKRSLTYGTKKTFKPYTQSAIYMRLFGISFDAHRAESDALALMQICSCYGEKFTEYADEKAKLFSDIMPRWVVRKSFKL